MERNRQSFEPITFGIETEELHIYKEINQLYSILQFCLPVNQFPVMHCLTEGSGRNKPHLQVQVNLISDVPLLLLHNNSMEQRPAREADDCLDNREYPRISKNSKVHYRVRRASHRSLSSPHSHVIFL
jgi:hypothetical protein